MTSTRTCELSTDGADCEIRGMITAATAEMVLWAHLLDKLFSTDGAVSVYSILFTENRITRMTFEPIHQHISC